MAASSIRTRVLLVAVTALLLTAAAQEGVPELRVVVGTVEIGSGEPPTWRFARAGEFLRPGDVLRTGPGARVELETAAGTVRLYERSTLRIPRGGDGASSLDLDSGASIFDIRHRPAGRPFEVRTPHAVVMVKGTRFTVSDDDDGASVAVQRGLVAVRGLSASEHEMMVHPGFALSGGAGRSFTLGLTPDRGDAWETWSRGAPAWRLSPPPRESRATPGVQSARAAAHAAASQQVTALVHREHSDGDRGEVERTEHPSSGGTASGGHSESSDPAGESPASPARGDGHSKAHDDDREVKQSYGEALLGGSKAYDIKVVKAGEHNRVVQIVGSGGLDVTFSRQDLKQVISGNTALLGPQLLGVLNSRGVSPGAFAHQMLDLL